MWGLMDLFVYVNEGARLPVITLCRLRMLWASRAPPMVTYYDYRSGESNTAYWMVLDMVGLCLVGFLKLGLKYELHG